MSALYLIVVVVSGRVSCWGPGKNRVVGRQTSRVWVFVVGVNDLGVMEITGPSEPAGTRGTVMEVVLGELLSWHWFRVLGVARTLLLFPQGKGTHPRDM